MAGLTWIKLNLDMFDNKKIKQIRKMPGGNDMVLFWVMLLTLAGKSNSQGYILFTENIAYTPEMLANEFDMELNTVKMALELFSRFNMISVKEETIVITGWSEHQNIEGMERAKVLANERVKRHRENKKKLLEAAQGETCSADCNVTETLQKPLSNGCETDIKKIDIRSKIEDIKKDRLKDTRNELNLIEHAYYNTFYRQMTPVYVKNTLDILHKGDYTELIIHAINLTKLRTEQQKKEKGFKYTLSILESWINKGYKNPEDVQRNEGELKTGTDSSNIPAAYKPFEFE
ncbi:phage replisome organizer N-terminal domain-containing protein [Clostridium swellfunianum]|uniref:phage replisome organizer N-terminal domain-containing protein n=1 Tax=Clostridium swellfunianum TaxID=1367462 RepID=UPI002030AC64|nr:phage replisome organizer N-terminal domain-containing protein [Clostridium swellfunianum]MCM0648673.1 phage replisome organizer N-terminal domain-containing protein [Clostridium swellfunianum]